jgi:thiamine-phosphate pyrophosphorylase
MLRRQTAPDQWLIIAEPGDWSAIRQLAERLPRRSGILVLQPLQQSEGRRLRLLAARRGLALVEEQPRIAARVHNVRELREALLARTKFLLLSPLYPTQTHPDWRPMPRMRAATLARLSGRRLIALGGMDSRRYAALARLGFSGWAGISSWRSLKNRRSQALTKVVRT